MRRTRRGLKWLGLALLILVVSGASYQAAAYWLERRELQPPGRLVDVGEFRLHLHTTGSAKSGPTFILDAGGTSFSSQYAWIQAALSDEFTVVAYDRPGLGWSERGSRPLDALGAATALRTALSAEGIDGPYVLLGHSFGSFPVRVFADRYADEVVGVVLLDATHPEQWHGQGPPGMFVFDLAPWLARVGYFRAFDVAGQQVAGLPEPVASEAARVFTWPRHLEAVAEEGRLWEVSATQASGAGDLGDLPLLVISSPDMTRILPNWMELQSDLVGLSSAGSQLVLPEATHDSLVIDEQDARVVAEAIRDFVTASVHP